MNELKIDLAEAEDLTDAHSLISYPETWKHYAGTVHKVIPVSSMNGFNIGDKVKNLSNDEFFITYFIEVKHSIYKALNDQPCAAFTNGGMWRLDELERV